ncbi:MAG TPA: threonine/serine dehydratase [Pseudolabrys sp.]|nr:threonine/serine dehydratase [Pseudolabrys sp.]
MTVAMPRAEPSLEKLEGIARGIAPYLHRTPVVHSDFLSKLTGYDVYLKAELFQKSGSFKPRGMLAKLLTLKPEDRARGAITFSAGNAAQGLAYAGLITGTPVTVVMPEAASASKAAATRGYGAKVVLHGDIAEAVAHCMAIQKAENLTFVSAFDDDDLMQGHASLGLEIVADLPDLDAIIVGIGGGGLIGGVALARNATKARTRIIGVEPTGAAAMTRSLEAGKPVRIEKVQTIADGLGAPFAGERTFPIVRDHVASVVLVSDEEIVGAIGMLLARCKWLSEGAGAASVAALTSGRLNVPAGSRVCCVVSGGNIDMTRLKSLL